MDDEVFNPLNDNRLKISIIAAIGKNNELGGNNTLLWRLSDDLKLFKQLTMGHCIIMGRKTFESIGKPLPGRINIVVTTGQINMEGIFTAIDLNHAVELARESGDDEAFIIGGGQIFGYAIDLADKLYITHVDAEFPEADIFLPSIDYNEWKMVESKSFEKNEKNEFDFEYKEYERKKPDW
ncbi:MAG: dihydrofolate reductase [Bacteroidia bacterium]